VDDPVSGGSYFREVIDNDVDVLHALIIPIRNAVIVSNFNATGSRVVIQFFWSIEEIDAYLPNLIHLNGLLIDGLRCIENRMHGFLKISIVWCNP
jgi:hypothetical protein